VLIASTFEVGRMNRAFKLSVIEVFENLAKIEELCESISFFFTRIYDMESSLSKRRRYAFVSRHVVFLAIQRAKLLSSETMSGIRSLEEHGILISCGAEELIEGVIASVARIERSYNGGHYEGMIKDVKNLGLKCQEIKQTFKAGVEL
jgi:hypothetical protein